MKKKKKSKQLVSLTAETIEKWKSLSCLRLFVTPWTIQPLEFSRPECWVLGSLSLLREFFPTQGSNPGLPYCRWILYQLSHKGSPRTLEWVAYPFSSQTSWPRNWTRVSCIAGGFFTNWAIREELLFLETIIKVRWATKVVCVLSILLLGLFQRCLPRLRCNKIKNFYLFKEDILL